MGDCCDPVPYRRLFNTKQAERYLRRYRRSGVDKRAADAIGYLSRQGIAGATVLEVGGGVGGVVVELLENGAGSAVSIDLSTAYEPAAARLAEEHGFTDRIEHRIGDFVVEADDVASTDVVFLNRVVCCYPHMPAMVSAAATKADRFLALVYPRERWWSKLSVALGNAYLSARRCDFRAFVHPIDGIHSVVADAGLSPVHLTHDLNWETAVFARA